MQGWDVPVRAKAGPWFFRVVFWEDDFHTISCAHLAEWSVTCRGQTDLSDVAWSPFIGSVTIITTSSWLLPGMDKRRLSCFLPSLVLLIVEGIYKVILLARRTCVGCVLYWAEDCHEAPGPQCKISNDPNLPCVIYNTGVLLCGRGVPVTPSALPIAMYLSI